MDAPAKFDLTLRVGCSLVYQATHPAVLILNFKPRPDRNHQVLAESLHLGDHLAAEEHVDTHGNILLRVSLAPGLHAFRHDAIVAVSSRPDNHDLVAAEPIEPGRLPLDLIRYTLPSRYCDSDRLADFTWSKFGQIEPGWPRVLAISDWIHRNIEYRYGCVGSVLSAWDILQRGYGVCRDLAHLAVAFNRTFNVPARYVAGHLPDVGYPDPDGHMDFHAYGEVYLGGHWHTTDARFHVPRIGRVKVACGFDAVEGAFSTIFGSANLTEIQVWAYQVAAGAVSVGDPLDLSKRLDNQWAVRIA